MPVAHSLPRASSRAHKCCARPSKSTSSCLLVFGMMHDSALFDLEAVRTLRKRLHRTIRRLRSPRASATLCAKPKSSPLSPCSVPRSHCPPCSLTMALVISPLVSAAVSDGLAFIAGEIAATIAKGIKQATQSSERTPPSLHLSLPPHHISSSLPSWR